MTNPGALHTQAFYKEPPFRRGFFFVAAFYGRIFLFKIKMDKNFQTCILILKSYNC